MATLSITVNDHVLESARIIALREGTSVEDILREHLERYAGKNARHEKATRRILDIARQSTATSNDKRWTRNDLYGC